jgi:hypothetical protein
VLITIDMSFASRLFSRPLPTFFQKEKKGVPHLE